MPLITLTVDTKFYTFLQNNSGGYFIEDDAHGICETVIIEASSFKDAYSKLESIGSNISGFFDFCECCGERWSDYGSDGDGYDVPSIWGSPIEEADPLMGMRNRAFIHYIDGRIIEHKHLKKDY